MFDYKTAEGEGDSKKLDSFHHRGPGSIDSDSLSTSVLMWEQRGVPECDMGWNTAEACAWKKENPPMLPQKTPTAFIWLKALATETLTWTYYEIQAGEVFNTGWESNTVS